jgi:hypothetical protein
MHRRNEGVETLRPIERDRAVMRAIGDSAILDQDHILFHGLLLWPNF